MASQHTLKRACFSPFHVGLANSSNLYQTTKHNHATRMSTLGPKLLLSLILTSLTGKTSA